MFLAGNSDSEFKPTVKLPQRHFLNCSTEGKKIVKVLFLACTLCRHLYLWKLVHTNMPEEIFPFSSFFTVCLTQAFISSLLPHSLWNNILRQRYPHCPFTMAVGKKAHYPSYELRKSVTKHRFYFFYHVFNCSSQWGKPKTWNKCNYKQKWREIKRILINVFDTFFRVLIFEWMGPVIMVKYFLFSLFIGIGKNHLSKS